MVQHWAFGKNIFAISTENTLDKNKDEMRLIFFTFNMARLFHGPEERQIIESLFVILRKLISC